MTVPMLYALAGAAAALLVDHTLGQMRREYARQRMETRLAEAAVAHPVETCPCELCVAWRETDADDALWC